MSPDPSPPHRSPTAAGTLLFLGEPGAALWLLLLSPAGPFPVLVAEGGVAGGEPQQYLHHGHLQLTWANRSLNLSRGLSSGLRLSRETHNVHEAQSITVLLQPGQGVCWGLVSRERGAWTPGVVS